MIERHPRIRLTDHDALFYSSNGVNEIPQYTHTMERYRRLRCKGNRNDAALGRQSVRLERDGHPVKMLDDTARRDPRHHAELERVIAMSDLGASQAISAIVYTSRHVLFTARAP